jgi:hypothetical protein
VEPFFIANILSPLFACRLSEHLSVLRAWPAPSCGKLIWDLNPLLLLIAESLDRWACGLDGCDIAPTPTVCRMFFVSSSR